MRRRLLGPTLLIFVLTGCGSPGAPSSPTSPPVTDPSAGTELVADVDVGGRTMHLVCVGPTDYGQPTILLEAGGGLDYSSWGEVLSGMSKTHRVCAYDRAGEGMSEPPAEASRTAADQVADLRTLLDAADVSGPFVLGSHSVGSYMATLFTQAFPDDVVGLVFVDPRAPHISAGWRAALPPVAADEPAALAGLREELEVFETDPSLNDEHLDLQTSGAQAIAALDANGPLFGDRPVIVLSADRERNGWSALPPDLAATFGDIWYAGQRKLADESTAGSFEPVPDVGHNIQVEDPTAVITAVEDVLAAIEAP